LGGLGLFCLSSFLVLGKFKGFGRFLSLRLWLFFLLTFFGWGFGFGSGDFSSLAAFPF
jgi:hypothetical protein